MDFKNIAGLVAVLLLIIAFIGSMIGLDNISLLVGIACFNWITYQAEQIKDKLK